MVSERQRAANSRNARSSTGPRTPEGKSVSSMNSIKHGLLAQAPILLGEDPEEYQEFRDQIIASLEPVGGLEKAKAIHIADLAWRARTAGMFEAGLFAKNRDSALAASAQKRIKRYERVNNECLEEWEKVEITDPDAHAAAIEDAQRYEDAQNVDLSLIGTVFERADAFSNLLRYESRIDRLCAKELKEFHNLQRRRQRREKAPQNQTTRSNHDAQHSQNSNNESLL